MKKKINIKLLSILGLLFTLSFFYDIIVFFIVVIATLYIPGFFFYRLFYSNKPIKIIVSFALFFSLGYSSFIIPALISYFLKLSWTYFITIWIIEIAFVIGITFNFRRNVFFSLYQQSDFYDYFIILVFILISVAMFFHGGHFTGDATFHLSSIMKLNENIKIDPGPPYFKGDYDPAFNYAFSILYIYFAFISKITGIGVIKLWEFSPAIFPVFIGSSLFYLFTVFTEDSKGSAFFIIIFLLWEIFNFKWLDFKFLPYPDQIARNIILPVALVKFLMSYETKLEKRDILFIAILVISIIYTHLYSFAAFFILCLFYSLFFLLINRDKEKFYNMIISYTFLVVICAPFILIRLFFSTYFNIFLRWYI